MAEEIVAVYRRKLDGGFMYEVSSVTSTDAQIAISKREDWGGKDTCIFKSADPPKDLYVRLVKALPTGKTREKLDKEDIEKMLAEKSKK